MDWINLLLLPVLRSVALIVVLLTGFAYLTWYERKLLARFQVRINLNSPAPMGCCSPSPAVKAVFKEEIVPNMADKAVYMLARLWLSSRR